MNATQRVTRKSLVPASALVMLLVGAGGSTAHADVSIDCSVPLNVQCTVSDPLGIASIVVELDTGLGPINVVDETYSCVSAATVSWDPIVPGGEFHVTTCGGILPPQSGSGWGQDVLTYDLRRGRIYIDENGGALDVPRPGIDYMMRTPLRLFGDPATGAKVSLLLPFLSSYSPGTSVPTLVEAAYCCPEGSTDGCFGVNLLAQCGEGLDFLYCPDGASPGSEACTSYPN